MVDHHFSRQLFPINFSSLPSLNSSFFFMATPETPYLATFFFNVFLIFPRFLSSLNGRSYVVPGHWQTRIPTAQRISTMNYSYRRPKIIPMHLRKRGIRVKQVIKATRTHIMDQIYLSNFRCIKHTKP